MKRLLLILTAFVSLTIATHASSVILKENMLVAFTKEDCKELKSIGQDGDEEGFKAMIKKGKVDIIMAGDKFFLTDVNFPDDVCTLRWHGKICYVWARALNDLGYTGE